MYLPAEVAITPSVVQDAFESLEKVLSLRLVGMSEQIAGAIKDSTREICKCIEKAASVAAGRSTADVIKRFADAAANDSSNLDVLRVRTACFLCLCP